MSSLSRMRTQGVVGGKRGTYTYLAEGDQGRPLVEGSPRERVTKRGGGLLSIVKDRDWHRVRGRAAKLLTTPLHPDDYLSLINPLWSARELRGRIERVVPETEDAATLVIKPGWGAKFDYEPGQYIGIGVEVDGRYHWRSYSLSSPPGPGRGSARPRHTPRGAAGSAGRSGWPLPASRGRRPASRARSRRGRRSGSARNGSHGAC